jgi:hypothetical protein
MFGACAANRVSEARHGATAAEDVYEAAEAHRLSLKNPSKSIAEYLNTLESQGLVRTVAELRLALL